MPFFTSKITFPFPIGYEIMFGSLKALIKSSLRGSPDQDIKSEIVAGPKADK